MPVKPIGQLAQRSQQEAGKIKIGVYKSGRPQSIDTFRFTSHDQEAIRQLAELYGGTVLKNSNDLWEVITEAGEIDVVLAPNCLGGTPIYMLWSGGGMQRQCDGETCTTYTDQGNDLVIDECPCICDAKGVLECGPETRLSVLLPQIRLGGVWNLRTKSEAAASEFTGMVDLIQAAQARGLTRAKLGIEARTARGKRRKFKVPVLRLEHSIEALMSGDAALRANQLEMPARPELSAPPAESTSTYISEDERHTLNERVKGLDPESRKAVLDAIKKAGIDTKHLTHAELSTVVGLIDDTLNAPWEAEVVDEI